MSEEKLKIIQTSMHGRYARALFEVAKEQNQIEFVLDSLCNFKSSVENAHIQLMTLCYINEKNFQEILDKCTKNFSWPLYLNHFFKLLYTSRRLHLIGQIIDVFELMTNESFSRVKAHIKIAELPGPAHKKTIENKIEELFGKKVRFEYQAIPSLLNGFVATINDSLQIDASFSTQINELGKTLKHTQLKGIA